MIWQFKFTIPDVAVLVILLFIFKIMDLLSVRLGDGFSARELPKTLQAVYKLVGIDNDGFTQYIVCPKCNAVVEYDDGYKIEGGKKIPSRCPKIHYPDHPHSSCRLPCGAYLMRSAKTRTGKTTVKPYKIYAYQPLKQAVTNLLNREGILDQFYQRGNRNEPLPEGLLCDIYDGLIWQHFQESSESNNLLASRYNIAFTLNTDWFQPFSKTRKIF